MLPIAKNVLNLTMIDRKIHKHLAIYSTTSVLDLSWLKISRLSSADESWSKHQVWSSLLLASKSHSWAVHRWWLKKGSYSKHYSSHLHIHLMITMKPHIHFNHCCVFALLLSTPFCFSASNILYFVFKKLSQKTHLVFGFFLPTVPLSKQQVSRFGRRLINYEADQNQGTNKGIRRLTLNRRGHRTISELTGEIKSKKASLCLQSMFDLQ